jgi:hypothetical protein
LLLGPLERRGLGRRITAAIFMVVMIEGLYLGAFSLAEKSFWGIIMMYALVFVPLLSGLILLHGGSEGLRGKMLRIWQKRHVIEVKP